METENIDQEWYYYVQGCDIVCHSLFYICDIELYADYVELTPIEVDFYCAHPGATAHEVRQLIMDNDMPPAPGVEVYRKRLKSEMRFEMLQRINYLMPPEKLRDAQVSLLAESIGCAPVLDVDTSTARIRYYNAVRDACAKEENRVYLSMLEARTYEHIRRAYTSCHLSEITTGKEVWNE